MLGHPWIVDDAVAPDMTISHSVNLTVNCSGSWIAIPTKVALLNAILVEGWGMNTYHTSWRSDLMTIDTPAFFCVTMLPSSIQILENMQ